ncbi:SIMPL domain-containing protein [Flexithrix dorotheae]|uniref:SIMPL domain-containing protein n=1 Tax=Flexithrix dorotheae TaxID=70993 RepID=UPI00036B5DEB|nr:SIMPL domain-containing protein [Flexithrix dorotheae]
MKTILLSFLLIAFFGDFKPAHAQRNMNQNTFKSNSKSDYMMRRQGGDFQSFQTNQSNIGGITQYTKENEMIFEVRTLMNVKANRFLAVFNLTQVGKTAVETDQLINERIKNFTSDLTQLAVTENDIYIDMIYLIPTFEFEVEKKLFSPSNYNEVPKGFEMQKNVHIAFTDINKIDDLVTLAAKNEIYDLVKIDFFVDNTEAVYDTLRERSVGYINKELKTFEKLNINFKDEFHVVKEHTQTIYPDSQYSDYEAFVSQSVDAIKKNSGVSTIRKPVTVAYDQIPYSEFHIVINPEILEPVVQYVYTMQVKYTLEMPESKNKKEYILVSPNGEMKKLEIE